MVFVSETKIYSFTYFSKKCNSMFDNFLSVSLVGSSEGLVLMWSNDINVKLLF